ncbi:hypothetical protein K488DRAFT_15251, partial [Vararia minispora EC-137]
LLSRALHRLRTTAPRVISSPPTQPRRAAVALVLRVVPAPGTSPSGLSSTQIHASQLTLSDFFAQEWVSHPGARPEILFLHRSNPGKSEAEVAGDSHVAFPGGRMEQDDEDGLFTAMRHTWEEIGIDLAEADYMTIGQLDDREITTSLGKRLLMILSPFVFLQLTSHSRPVDPSPDTTLHWVPLASLLPSPSLALPHSISYPEPIWSSVNIDTASRLAPRHSIALKLVMRVLVGSMQFPALVLVPPSEYGCADVKRPRAMEAGSGTRTPPLKLWGLTLGMTLDLLAYMAPQPLTPWDADALMGITGVDPSPGTRGRQRRVNAPPSLTSVFPRFSYPDVNFWIWVFGKRYREVIRGWETSVRNGGLNDRRINWTGAALTTFYAAVRKALVVVLILRALGLLVGVAVGLWWVL